VSIYQKALLGFAVVAAVISADDRRALLWILAGAADFIITTAYQRSGITTPPYPLVTGIADAVVCLALWWFWDRRWEKYLFLIFQLSVLISLFRLIRVIDTNYAYVTALEVCNYLALLVIGGTHLLGKVDVGLGSHTFRGLHWIVGDLYAHRQHE
jgi:hypothetical protein